MSYLYTLNKQLGLLLLLFFHGLVWSQKAIQKSFIPEGVTSIQIDASTAYQVQLRNSEDNEFHIEADMEGEYSIAQLISIVQEANTVLIKPDFHKSYSLPNDKLSAHKVLSVALLISVPKNLGIFVKGEGTLVDVKGVFKKLSLTLNDGKCILETENSNLEVKTHSGSITAVLKAGDVHAKSTYGEVFMAPIPKSTDHIQLESVSGNIYLKARNK